LENRELQSNCDDMQIIVNVSKWTRLLNFVIDYIVVMIFVFILSVLVALVFGEKGITFLTSIPDLLLGVISMSIYYIVFEGITGKTIGKYITGTKVVTENGEKAPLIKIIGRTLCRFIPFEVLSFFGPLERGWHDSIPNTYVIKSR